MSKYIFKNAMKNLFRKTEIVCPSCGTVQGYSSTKCRRCAKNLRFLHDKTLLIKNVIRAVLGVCVAAGVIAGAFFLHHTISPGAVDETSGYRDAEITSDESDNITSVAKTTEDATLDSTTADNATEPETEPMEPSTEPETEPTEPSTEPVTEPPTERPTEAPTERPTEAPTVPEYTVEWVCIPCLNCADIMAGSDIIGKDAGYRLTNKGDWWSRVFFTDNLQYNGCGNYYKTDFGIADYNGNIILPSSYKIKVSNAHYAVFSEAMDAWGAVYDVDGTKTGDYAFGIGEDGRTVYNTYNGKLVYMYMGAAIERDVEAFGNGGQIMYYKNIYYDGKYVKDEINNSYCFEDFSKVKELDSYTIIYCATGKVVAVADDVFREDCVDGENYLIVRNGNKYAYINYNGKSFVPGEYEEAYTFREGVAAVKKDGKAGFIDTSGKTVIPFIFEETRTCYDGKAWVKYNGLWGVIKVK